MHDALSMSSQNHKRLCIEISRAQANPAQKPVCPSNLTNAFSGQEQKPHYLDPDFMTPNIFLIINFIYFLL